MNLVRPQKNGTALKENRLATNPESSRMKTISVFSEEWRNGRTMDHVSTEKRSEIMRKIKSKDTTPEMTVRRLLHSMGHRYRLHRKELPGKPDIVFISKKKAIFVHGCFWHRHRGCKWTTTPKTRVFFWKNKFESNIERDRKAVEDLEASGWDVLIVWQCQTGDVESLKETLQGFLANESEKRSETSR